MRNYAKLDLYSELRRFALLERCLIGVDAYIRVPGFVIGRPSSVRNFNVVFPRVKCFTRRDREDALALRERRDLTAVHFDLGLTAVAGEPVSYDKQSAIRHVRRHRGMLSPTPCSF